MPMWDVEETVKRSRLVLMGKRLPVKEKGLQIMMCSSAGHMLTGAFACAPSKPAASHHRAEEQWDRVVQQLGNGAMILVSRETCALTRDMH